MSLATRLAGRSDVQRAVIEELQDQIEGFSSGAAFDFLASRAICLLAADKSCPAFCDCRTGSFTLPSLVSIVVDDSRVSLLDDREQAQPSADSDSESASDDDAEMEDSFVLLSAPASPSAVDLSASVVEVKVGEWSE